MAHRFLSRLEEIFQFTPGVRKRDTETQVSVCQILAFSSMLIKRNYHYLVATLVWAIPGFIITMKGILAYSQIPFSQWWLFAITLCVICGFYFIFGKVVKRYIAHISGLPERSRFWHTFPLKGWLLIVFMMALGITLRHIQGIPIEFFASFYSGLGPMLLCSAVQFLKKV